MLDKVGTFKQAARNLDGPSENRTDRNFDKDHYSDSLVVPNYSALKIYREKYERQQQLLHYLHQQRLHVNHYQSFLHHHISQFYPDDQSDNTSLAFHIDKTEFRSIEKRRFLSPSHKECKEENEDGEKRESYGDYEEGRRMLEGYLRLHPNSIIDGLNRPHEAFKQQAHYQYLNSHEQQCIGEQKMDNEEDFDIKVDDIDGHLGESEEKFNNSKDGRSSSMNGRISCSSDSAYSGDEYDVGSSINGGRHKDNNNNNNILKTTEVRIIDINTTKTSTDSDIGKDLNSSKNNRFIKNHDTDYQLQINNDNNKNKMKETLTGECDRHTPDSLPPDQVIFTHEDVHNPPDLTKKFTNFFIDDILKPEFGKKPFETGTTTFTPVERTRLNKSFSSSSSFPFSISSLSQSSSLSSSSSSSSIASQNSSVPSPGKKKSFSRYASNSRYLPSKSPLSSISVSSLDSSRTPQIESDNQQTLSLTSLNKAKKDLTETPVEPKSSENLPDSTGFQFKYPAWVFCTRYSDRPSSGKRYSYFLSLACMGHPVGLVH